jgi:5'-deoxynucleotidase YfbR-like HD superfamily hydrolase
MSDRSARVGNWSQTFTGLQFWPCDPRREDVRVEDIAHALALQCRFAGHCRVPYSVAEHSVRVAEWVWDETSGDRRASLAALLHDASEAYCVDVPRPLKPYLTGYREIEHGVMHVIEALSLIHISEPTRPCH